MRFPGIRRNSANCPLIIYTPGKVGSSTVHHTLMQLKLDLPVYHVHFLDPVRHRKMIELFSGFQGKPPKHVMNGIRLSEQYKKQGTRGWKIITLTREYVSRTVSDFFEQLDQFPGNHPEIYRNEREIDPFIVTGLIADKLKRFNPQTDYLLNWYKKELQQFFGIDIYNDEYDREKGYHLHHENGIDFLLLRMEDLDRSLKPALSDLLDIEPVFDMITSNITTRKKTAEIYRFVKDHLEPPEEFLEKLNATLYHQHFYG